jgi:hypothetical protein
LLPRFFRIFALIIARLKWKGKIFCGFWKNRLEDFTARKKNVNSQSKFHSRKAVEISMRNQWKLVWEKEEKK